MDRYAVIGHPVMHSLSPRIHAAFAEAAGAQLRYEAIDVVPEALAARLRELHAEGYRGLNVTLPHKTAVAALCESLAERARLAEAANVLIRTDTGWRGDNSDGVGLVADVTRNLGVKLTGKRLLVLGSGGAARGILAPLLQAGPAELVLSNRSPWVPEALAPKFAALGPIRPSTHLALKGDRFDVVFNATSAGHQGTVPHLAAGLFADGALAYDLNYGAAAAPFLDWAREQGAAQVSDGLGMLVEQAAVSFALWRGQHPATTAVLAALRAG